MYETRDIPVTDHSQWPTPNYVNPERRTWMPGFILAWQIVSTILISGRFYLRGRKQAGSFGFDDVLVFFGWLWSLGLSINTWYDVTQFGVDRHVWDMRPEWTIGAAKTGWIAQVFFVGSTVCTKISVLLFHRRMINLTIDSRWLWAIRGALAFTTAYGIGCITAYFLYCTPLEAVWMAYSASYDKPHKCMNGSQVALVPGVLSVVSDLMAVAIPCLMLNHYDLHVSKKQKLALNITFAIGLTATGAGVARTYYLWKVQHDIDSTWTGFSLLAWSIVECHLAIICACAPSLRVFFRRYLMDTLRRSLSSVSHYAHGSHDRKEPLCSADFMSTANRDSRGFCELKELESGVHGLTIPPPVIVGDSSRVSEKVRYVETSTGKIVEKKPSKTKRHHDSPPPTPPITSAEEYESYAIERLSRHETVVREKSFTGLSQRASRTASILNRFDDFVVDQEDGTRDKVDVQIPNKNNEKS
ncbi:hypothetical protein AC578_6164 [Pseudocercospora eumusae]|uniref:Rhodopsin domain-containing protein n=1 Tax=Pseudocercospora eumusae TaxID=321146 RepID=A0A139H977_9PEZI|nr:hypothetical protein AC578_6164 [Pseudocercospora eumusae]